MAAEWAGFETVGQCEFADYPTKVLEKHWPDVPRWRDIRDVTAEKFRASTGLSTVDLISGGFPCQPFSVIGKRRGEKDERYLFDEMLRVASELRAKYIVGENVTGIDDGNLDRICAKMEKEKYEVKAILEVPACLFGAPHERYRTFIIAHATSEPRIQTNPSIDSDRKQRNARKDTLRSVRKAPSGQYWEENQSPILGVPNGLPTKLDEHKQRAIALGNAVVPQQVYPIFKAIAEIESG